MHEPYIVLTLTYRFNGMVQHLYPVLLRGAGGLVLIDCGYPGSLPLLEEQLRLHHMDPGSLTKLVLTHQDDDHIGAAAALKEAYPAIQILASPTEAPYIAGAQKNLRLQQAEALQKQLPDPQKAWGEQFCGRYRQLKPVPVDGLLRPGDVFDWGGGCEILDTPGHLSLRSLTNDFLITGDAAVLEDEILAIANPDFCLDIKKAAQSLEEIRRFQCSQYICYHGGILKMRPSVS